MANVYVSARQIRVEDLDALVETVQIAIDVFRSTVASSMLIDNAFWRVARRVRICDACRLRHNLEIILQFIIATARTHGRDFSDAVVARESSARMMQSARGRRCCRRIGAMVGWFQLRT